jgi:hypothetical protein
LPDGLFNACRLGLCCLPNAFVKRRDPSASFCRLFLADARQTVVRLNARGVVVRVPLKRVVPRFEMVIACDFAAALPLDALLDP